MRVVALYRVSTEKQANEGASLDSQQRKYKHLARENKWTTVAEFRGCESATLAASDRRVLQQALESLRSNSVDAIYVHEQSRLTRGDELEVATLFRELRERSIKVIVGGVVRDLASIDERFMIGIQSLVDRAESERIKERVARGKREKALQGKKNSGPTPYGYRNPLQGDSLRGTLQIVFEQARVVRQVFEWAAAGMGGRTICDKLNAQGVKPPRGQSWGKTTIQRMLKNPVYLGTHVSNGWVAVNGSRTFEWQPQNERAIVVENAHTPIIDVELWNQVHARPKPRRQTNSHLLTGLLWINGSRCRGDITNGRRFYATRTPRNREPWLEVEYADETVWDMFTSMTCDSRFLAALIRQAHQADCCRASDEDIKRIQAGIERHRQRLDRLVDMRADGEISKDVYLEKSHAAAQALAQAEIELRQARAERSAHDGTWANAVTKAVRLLIGNRLRISPEQKAAILRTVVQRIDATVYRSHHQQTRDHLGRLQAMTGPKWLIGDLDFDLVIPVSDRAGHLAQAC